MARTELGDQKVQGLDYAYTSQGWLKGVNSSSLHDGLFDIGQDGKTGGSLPIVGRDVFGYMLDYYIGDYKPIGQQAFSLNTFTSPSPTPATGFKSLYNGNIGGMVTNIRQLNTPQYTYYHYDQLNRIKRMEALNGQNAAANTWTFGLRFNGYIESFSYDPNGNIKTLARNSNVQQIDDLTYIYLAGTNKLISVADPIPSGLVNYDIDGQGANNYSYDRIGNMTSDNAEGITNISWTVYRKIKSITKSNGTIHYRYDASGNRIYKKTVISGTTTETYYARDAQGNVMGVYEKQAANPLKWMEQHFYGSSRLGMWNLADVVPSTTIPASGGTVEDGYLYGSKLFELSNHLGNVLVTVSDKKIGIDDGGNGTTDYFQPEVLAAQDYYSGGMQMVGRTFDAAGSTAYRYGFNGKENDNEVKGEGNQQDYGMRIYDPRLGKFLSVDPIGKEYPWYTPYQFAGNKPMWCVDLDGLEESQSTNAFFKSIFGSPAAYNNPKSPMDLMSNDRLQKQRAMHQTTLLYAPHAAYSASGGDKMYSQHSSWDKLGSYSVASDNIPSNMVNVNAKPSASAHNERISNLRLQFMVDPQVTGSETGLVNLLLGSMFKGNAPENIVFPTDGFGSNYLRNSSQVNEALSRFASFGTMEGKASTPTIGSSLANMLTKPKLEDFVGYIDYKMNVNFKDGTVLMTMTNVTSLTSGTLGKEVFGSSVWPESILSGSQKNTNANSNFSQTFSLTFKLAEVFEKYRKP